MSVKYKRRLLSELRDPEFRHHYVEEHLRHRIAALIRNNREFQRLDQEELAEKMGTTQSRVSLLEDVKYGRLTIQSLLKVFKALDIALFVDAVPFSEFLKVTDNLTRERLSSMPFNNDLEQQELELWANASTEESAA